MVYLELGKKGSIAAWPGVDGAVVLVMCYQARYLLTDMAAVLFIALQKRDTGTSQSAPLCRR